MNSEPPANDPPPLPDPASGPSPVLPYHTPRKIEARWGMPLSAQLIFGAIFLFAPIAIVGLSVAAVGPLALVIFIGLVLIAEYVRREWKWMGFGMGIVFAIGASILLAGICAVFAMH